MFHNCNNLECDLSNWNSKEDAITKTMFKTMKTQENSNYFERTDL